MTCTIPDHPNWLTAVTHMFLHGGWFHLIGNLWFLWVFGDNVEDAMGGLRFAAFYVICGLAAFAAQALANPSSAIPMVGASGAIGGVMGAYARLYPRAPVHLMVVFFVFVNRTVVPAFLMLGYWFLIQVLAGIPSLASEAGGVAFWAHVGGFLAGVLLIGVFSKPERVAAHRALVARGA
jgi:membrane associated rhomboid family serine protease